MDGERGLIHPSCTHFGRLSSLAWAGRSSVALEIEVFLIVIGSAISVSCTLNATPSPFLSIKSRLYRPIFVKATASRITWLITMTQDTDDPKYAFK